MFLHFEDNSAFSHRLRDRGLPNTGKIIKVFATFTDPNVDIPGFKFKTVMVSGDAFSKTEYVPFDGRPKHWGRNFLESMERLGLTDISRQLTFGLLRFSILNGFMNNAMKFKLDPDSDKYWLQDPINVVHGFDKKNPFNLHLDIFLPDSIKRLSSIIDIKNPELMVPITEGTRWRTKLYNELTSRN